MINYGEKINLRNFFSDKKDYRVIRLENGLTALLISDESYPFDKLDQEEKDLVEKESTENSEEEK